MTANMNGAPGSSPLSPWQRDRLTEAHAILADSTHHRDSLNLLACRVVLKFSPDRTERADARALIRLLEGGAS